MSDDLAELEALMNRFLQAVSFRSGGQPRYHDLHALFVDGAKLIKTASTTPEISTVREFIKTRQDTVDSGALVWFQEIETANITENFGNVAHRFSTYEKRGSMDGAAIDVRGAISTQFIRTADGWRMSSMAWDDERPGFVLPTRYDR